MHKFFETSAASARSRAALEYAFASCGMGQKRTEKPTNGHSRGTGMDVRPHDGRLRTARGTLIEGRRHAGRTNRAWVDLGRVGAPGRGARLRRRIARADMPGRRADDVRGDDGPSRYRSFAALLWRPERRDYHRMGVGRAEEWIGGRLLRRAAVGRRGGLGRGHSSPASLAW